jgi:tetratricopeptide (TPR) repeat protein
MKKISFYKCMMAMLILLMAGRPSFSQPASTPSPMDALQYGVVLDDPQMKNVQVQKDITFLSDEKGTLKLDLYALPGMQAGEKHPAVIFLNAIGERSGQRKVKSWGIYTTWPTLMAANGYIGISMEADGARINESIKALFDFIDAKGSQYNIDKDKLGVYAASANVTGSVDYLMSEKAYKGIKAAVLYYGRAPGGPFRKDLPVLFVISEGDVRPDAYNGLWDQVLKNNAPWTIKMGTGMPHAFDAFSDNDTARIIVKETISFWRNYLDAVPASSFPHSSGRDVLGLLQMNRPKALALLKTIVDENPTDIQALKVYADVLGDNNDVAGAEAAFKKVLALDPKDAGTMINLAGLAYKQNKPAEAEKYIADVVNSGEMTRDRYADIAFTLLVAGKDKESAVYYEKALAMEPRGVDYYNLACAYAKVNDAGKAVKALDSSLKYGYGTKQQIESDPDFKLIRSDNGYKTFIEKLSK